MSFLKKAILKSAALISFALLIFLFGLFPNLVENYYSTGSFPYLSSTLRLISSVFPFALGDVLYLLLVFFVLYKMFKFYKRRKTLNRQHRITVPLQVLNFVLVLYLVFKIAWGLNYSRQSIAKSLGIGNEKYSVEQLALLAKYFVKKTNDLKVEQLKTPTYTIKELESGVTTAYRKMAKNNSLFEYRNPSLKAPLNSWLISKIGIEGYYNPLSGEANLNLNLPEFVKPYVACHEIAHQLGVAYEDEANLMGYLTANSSNDVNYRYAANYEMLRYILYELRVKSPDKYETIYAEVAPSVQADFRTEKEFWRKYNSQMFGYMDAVFDRLLKLNDQKKGTDSYQDIVIWLWNIYKNELKVES